MTSRVVFRQYLIVTFCRYENVSLEGRALSRYWINDCIEYVTIRIMQ